jgi:hypothetical protein
VSAQNNEESKSQIVEASCGANLEWKDTVVELAVRIDGNPYFVDGTLSFQCDAHALTSYQGIRVLAK